MRFIPVEKIAGHESIYCHAYTLAGLCTIEAAKHVLALFATAVERDPG
jgi:hypothetical protein